jgi:hypothetical protein
VAAGAVVTASVPPDREAVDTVHEFSSGSHIGGPWWACSCGACGGGRGDLREQWARHLTEPSP